MKPSQYSAFSLLVLFIFFSSTVQGIRLEKSSKPTGSHPLKEVALMKNGKGRKLFTVTTSTSPSSTTTSKREEINGENKVNDKPASKLKSASKEGSDGKQEKLHDQYAEIVEMDYSPARRKPPIHN